MLALQSEPKSAPAKTAPPSAPARLPLLANGDLLHSKEFLRRYDRMPDVKKAELIEGVVYMGSPVSISHARPDGLVIMWLATYAARTPGTEALPNTTVILDSQNTVQPDANGLLRSRLFPGLQLPLAALLALDGAKVMTCLEEGLASPAHADLARILAQP